MRHPYTVVPSSRPPSLFSTRSRPSTPEPQPNRRPLTIESPPPVPPLPSIIPLGGIHPNHPGIPGAGKQKAKSSGSGAARGHYVKHSSKMTLLLSGQEEGVDVPAYSTGETIEGIFAIAKPSGLFALEVKIEGTIRIEEIGGSGSRTVRVIDEMVYSWIPGRDGPLPPKASFRYTLPTTFLDPDTDVRYPLPSTYSAKLDGIPGFRVEIAYTIAVNLTHQREAATLWRGFTSMRVPFRYTFRTRPALPGPFLRAAQKIEDKPRTVFLFHIRPWRNGAPGIKVHVYLPASQVCSAQEPIPFHVALLGDELALSPFADYHPPATSFLSLSASSSNTSTESIASSAIGLLGHAPRRAAQRCPLRIKVQRTTIVDSRCAGPASQPHLYSSEWIGQGVVHGVSSTVNSVVWSGAIIMIPGSSAAALGGGFEVDGLRVVDSIVLSIEAPQGSRPQYIPLSETIPLRLTSDSFSCQGAIPISQLAIHDPAAVYTSYGSRSVHRTH
ncbi:hypothetical protein BV20DRAFT_953703 [Pilatotrama ljubarskyi]|nr:hypothetical protein BV20DRAFT_953703 [Pilatotrama ljubarskyi]